MRQLTVEIVNGETAGECVAWLLLMSMWARQRLSVAGRNTVDHCAEVLSTALIAGGTPMRQLILKIVDDEIAGKYVAWPLPTAMRVRRRQGEIKDTPSATALRHCPM